MPTFDRRGRARRRPEDTLLRGVELYRAMHAAKGDPEAWAELRQRAIRGLTTTTVDPGEAAKMFDAYGKKPMFIPSLPPTNR